MEGWKHGWGEKKKRKKKGQELTADCLFLSLSFRGRALVRRPSPRDCACARATLAAGVARLRVQSS